MKFIQNLQTSWQRFNTDGQNLFIDASHLKKQIVLKSKYSIEEYEYENKNKLNFKNNIYLGTVSRCSLQAALLTWKDDIVSCF